MRRRLASSSSCAGEASHGTSSQSASPSVEKFSSSSRSVAARRMCASRKSVARLRRVSWMSCRRAGSPSTTSSSGRKDFSCGGRSRRETQSTPFSISLGPISRRTGTPFFTHSHFLAPPPRSRSSTRTRIGRPWKVRAARRPASARAWESTALRVSGLGVTGRMTTCSGATRGGQMSPSSSACSMTRAPIMRVETPQEVVHANLRSLSRPAKQIFCDRAKF